MQKYELSTFVVNNKWTFIKIHKIKTLTDEWQGKIKAFTSAWKAKWSPYQRMVRQRSSPYQRMERQVQKNQLHILARKLTRLSSVTLSHQLINWTLSKLLFHRYHITNPLLSIKYVSSAVLRHIHMLPEFIPCIINCIYFHVLSIMSYYVNELFTLYPFSINWYCITLNIFLYIITCTCPVIILFQILQLHNCVIITVHVLTFTEYHYLMFCKYNCVFLNVTLCSINVISCNNYFTILCIYCLFLLSYVLYHVGISLLIIMLTLYH